MIDIESDTATDEVKLKYIRELYIQRDLQIWRDKDVNVLEYVFEKAIKYKMIGYSEKVEKLVKQRCKSFYNLFSLEDLIVLGY